MLLGAETAAACRRMLALLTTTLFLLQGSVALMRGKPNTSARGLGSTTASYRARPAGAHW